MNIFDTARKSKLSHSSKVDDLCAAGGGVPPNSGCDELIRFTSPRIGGGGNGIMKAALQLSRL